MKRFRLIVPLILPTVLAIGAVPARAEQSKVDRLLQQNGFQIAANADAGGDFSIARLQGANYSTLLWQWTSDVSRQGAAPGIPWGRWANDEQHMPADTASEAPYMSKLSVLQLSDEPKLETPSEYTRMVAWMQSAKANPAYNNTLL